MNENMNKKKICIGITVLLIISSMCVFVYYSSGAFGELDLTMNIIEPEALVVTSINLTFNLSIELELRNVGDTYLRVPNALFSLIIVYPDGFTWSSDAGAGVPQSKPIDLKPGTSFYWKFEREMNFTLQGNYSIYGLYHASDTYIGFSLLPYWTGQLKTEEQVISVK